MIVVELLELAEALEAFVSGFMCEVEAEVEVSVDTADTNGDAGDDFWPFG